MSSPGSPRPNGSSALTQDDNRRRRPWWLLPIFLVIAFLLLLLLLSRCGGDSEETTTSGEAETSAPPSKSASATSTASATASAAPMASSATASEATSASVTPTPGDPSVAAGGAGSTLTSAGTSLLPASPSAGPVDLVSFVGQPAQARGVEVLSVPADEGFWVGASNQDRVWVQLVGSGESPFKVKAGDLVDFDGSVVAHDGGFAETAGVTSREGAGRLTRAASHLEVPTSSLLLSTP